MAEDDDFFGYNIASLRHVSVYNPTMPLQETEDLNKGFYADRGNVSYEDVPAPEDNTRDIEFINAQIMGEQPGTAEYRALQWGKAGLLLSSVQNQLRDQTKELAETWESPRAKEIFLGKVGETLAFLDVWHEAATTNSYALTVLAGIMREGQNEMRDLYAEYQAAIKRSATEESLARAMTPAGNNSPVQKARDMHESGPPSTQVGDEWRAKGRESMRTAEENKANYDVWARELASRVAERYMPVIQRLENGRAKKMTPLNAVNHPGAYGPPMKIKTPPAPPGGPGGAPDAPPGPPPAPDTPPSPDGLKDKLPSPDGLKDTLPDATDTPDAPKAPDPTALQNIAPTLPGIPTPTLPVAPNLPGAPPPGLSPETLTALTNALSTLAPGLRTLTSTGGLSLDASQTSPFTARAPSAPPGLYPPNTITPPPGGMPNQPKAQGKVLGQRAQQNPPPGAAGRTNGQDRQKKAVPGTETSQAFQPPPAPNSPVLGNQKNNRARAGSAKEAPATGQPVTPPNATSPVLSNRHRGNGPAKTYGEQRAARRRAQQRRPEQETPEIATGVPTGTAPVLSGRFASAPETNEAAPITLRGRELTPAVRDEHAPPEVHADRTTRAPRQAEPATAEQSAWQTENPGGPVVASGTQEKQYRPEPPNALGTR